MKEKIRFSIPLDLLVQVYNTKKADETFDERIEHLLRLGMTEDDTQDVFALHDDVSKKQIKLKQGGQITIYKGLNIGFIEYDLWESNFDLTIRGHAIVTEFLFRSLPKKPIGEIFLDGRITSSWHVGCVMGIPNDKLEETATELKCLLENPENIEEINRTFKRLERDRIKPDLYCRMNLNKMGKQKGKD